LDCDGYIGTTHECETSRRGVFAAGEITTVDKKYRQAITAASQGCISSFTIQRFLAKEPLFAQQPKPKPKPKHTRSPRSPQKQTSSHGGENENNRFMHIRSSEDLLRALTTLQHTKHPTTVLIELGRTSCPSCAELGPLLEEVGQSLAPSQYLLQLDIDHIPDIDDVYKIMTGQELQAIPSLILWRSVPQHPSHGTNEFVQIGSSVGNGPESHALLRSFVSKATNGPVKQV
jgi:hypothetical protein